MLTGSVRGFWASYGLLNNSNITTANYELNSQLGKMRSGNIEQLHLSKKRLVSRLDYKTRNHTTALFRRAQGFTSEQQTVSHKQKWRQLGWEPWVNFYSVKKLVVTDHIPLIVSNLPQWGFIIQ